MAWGSLINPFDSHNQPDHHLTESQTHKVLFGFVVHSWSGRPGTCGGPHQTLGQ